MAWRRQWLVKLWPAAVLAPVVESECEATTTPPEVEARVFRYENLRRRWPADAAGLEGIPKRAWPEVQPSASDLPALRKALAACEKQKKPCLRERFLTATACLDASFESAREAPGLYHVNAELGDPDALCALGQCYQYGTGIEENDQAAAAWYLRAAGLGHAQAQYAIGAYFYCGDGALEENETLAVKFFQQAADKGHPGAAYMLGDCYLEAAGGLEKDQALAKRWLLYAGDNGHRGARSRLFALAQSTPDPLSKFTDASRQTLKRTKTELYSRG